MAEKRSDKMEIRGERERTRTKRRNERGIGAEGGRGERVGQQVLFRTGRKDGYSL